MSTSSYNTGFDTAAQNPHHLEPHHPSSPSSRYSHPYCPDCATDGCAPIHTPVFYQGGVQVDEMKRVWRRRLSEAETHYLERSFKWNSHPATETYEVMSRELRLPVKSLRMWYRNRRHRDLKAAKDIGAGRTTASPRSARLVPLAPRPSTGEHLPATPAAKDTCAKGGPFAFNGVAMPFHTKAKGKSGPTLEWACDRVALVDEEEDDEIVYLGVRLANRVPEMGVVRKEAGTSSTPCNCHHDPRLVHKGYDTHSTLSSPHSAPPVSPTNTFSSASTDWEREMWPPQRGWGSTSSERFTISDALPYHSTSHQTDGDINEEAEAALGLMTLSTGASLGAAR